jgi:ubiquinone biosynthesis protein COQ9
MITFMAKPEHAELGSRLLYKTLDRVWRAAGDRSTDFNFYTKRATLGAVYGATMLAFLDDDTPDMQKTRAFLDRRLQDVAKIPKVTKPLRAAANMVGTVASRMFTKSSNNTSH